MDCEPKRASRRKRLAKVEREPTRPKRARPCSKDDWTVIVDLPDPVPIFDAEMHVLEVYLGKALDDLLG